MSFTFVTAPQITDTFQANGKKRRKPMSPEALKARGVRISQTKLAKRKVHNKICPRCQKPFVANRKGKMCCSEECARLLQSQRLKANGHRPQKFVNTETGWQSVKSKRTERKYQSPLPARFEQPPKVSVSARSTLGLEHSSSDHQTAKFGMFKTSRALYMKTPVCLTLIPSYGLLEKAKHQFAAMQATV